MGEITWLSKEAENASGGNRLMLWRAELAEYYSRMKGFEYLDPVDIFLGLSQFSARASEMRSQIGMPESKSEQSFRVRIIDPFLIECDRQFKIHSRIQSVHEMEAKLSGSKFIT